MQALLDRLRRGRGDQDELGLRHQPVGEVEQQGGAVAQAQFRRLKFQELQPGEQEASSGYAR